MSELKFSDLVGKTLVACAGKKGYDEVEFETTDGSIFKLYHSQDCCESVRVEDICGELSNLVGCPILQAEESTSFAHPAGYNAEYSPESFTWTFYRIATIKGSVTIRFYGESNGYYSESVDFVKIK